ncbi:MAG: zinc-dependent alcohol dehydrogenase family protein [Acidimicrobiales bacterium]
MSDARMNAWIVDHPTPIGSGAPSPVRRVERPVPVPGSGQVRVRVRCCGVCRTDLHLAEGDLTPRRHGVTPGHEVVGVVEELGPGAQRFEVGRRVGVPWLASTCGSCRFCLAGAENLCLAPRFTGWDVDGGYADCVLVDERFAYVIPDVFDDATAAPLLCAGIIGYRALKRSGVGPGDRLGVYGFGGSAHLAAQVAIAMGATVHVMTRSAAARELALELGAASAQGADAPPPELLDAAVLFAPVGTLVPPALEALDRGGTLAIAGIHLSDIPVLDYQRHLFNERTLCSVTANTRGDGEEFLALAADIGIDVETTAYPMGEADRALADLAADRLVGAAVLVND